MSAASSASPVRVAGAGSDGVVQWAIMGAGRIAHRFARSLAHEPHSRLVAISCRSGQKADAFAAEFDVPAGHAYADDRLGDEGRAHEALLADAEVDAVYIALPHSMHFEWVLAALRAGKAVLCEKPAMLSAAQMNVVADVAWDRKVLFMEAMKCRFVPMYAKVKNLLAKGAVGTVASVEATLCNDMGDRVATGGDYLSSSVGGGVLLDTGIYCASWLEELLVAPPVVKHTTVEFEHGVDVYVDSEMRFGSAFAWLECATNRRKPRRLIVAGNAGRLVVEELHRSERAVVWDDGDAPFAVTAPLEVDDFYGEIEHFTQLVRDGMCESPIMPVSASLRCAQILDVVRASFPQPPEWSSHARSGGA